MTGSCAEAYFRTVGVELTLTRRKGGPGMGFLMFIEQEKGVFCTQLTPLLLVNIKKK